MKNDESRLESASWPTRQRVTGRSSRRQGLSTATILLLCVPAFGVGCHATKEQPIQEPKQAEVTCVQPRRASVHWIVRQPGRIEAFEETPIFPKIMGYVEKWNVDIGDRVQKGDILAELWVPDLVGELREREAEVEQARKALDVAQAQVKATATLIDEAKAGVDRSMAERAFSKTQYQRISKLESSVIEKQVKTESLSQLQAREATTAEAQAKVAHAHAALREAETVSEKCRADIAVAAAARDRTQALVDYATLKAPFDGVITRRNVHTGDFVQPPAGAAQQPLYVLERRDVVRVFIDVPEKDAVWLKPGMPANIHVGAVNGLKRGGEITRMAYSLTPQSRTLMAEIDLDNEDDLLRPGMYVNADITISRDHLLTLPASALAIAGDVNEGYQTYCYLLMDDKVHRCQIETGSRGDRRIEIIRKRLDDRWIDFEGDEVIVAGNISALNDGQRVTIAARTNSSKTQLDATGTAAGDGLADEAKFRTVAGRVSGTKIP